MKQLSCDQCHERWDEHINKSTFEADPQFADIRAHLESCADCRKTFDVLVAARQELQQLPMQKAPDSLRASILREIEKPQEQVIPWWNSLFVSPQHLAWASGAMVTVFVVALLMRPERQTQVMDSQPKVLTNRAQVEAQNSAPPQPAQAPSKSKNDLPAKKVLSKKPRETSVAKSPAAKKQRDESSETKQQKFVTPVPESTIDNTRKMPAPSTNNHKPASPQASKAPTLAQDNAMPEPNGLTSPAPKPQDSAISESRINEDAGIAKSYTQNNQKPMNRSIAKGARGPEGAAAAMQTFKSQNSTTAIHWSKTITSDYDVANAKIIITLGDNLAFTNENSKLKERTLWQGTLYRDKKIPLNIELLRTSNTLAKVHLKMINTATQNILLDKVYDVE